MTNYQHSVSGNFGAGDVWTTTLHTNSAQNLATVHAAWTTQITNFFNNTYAAMMPSDVTVSGTMTNQLDPLTSKNVAQSTSALAIIGTGAGGKPSPRDCVLLSLRTNLPQKKGRGRMFLPSVDTSHYTVVGKLSTADMQTVCTGFATILTALAATATPVIYHRSTVSFDVITSVKVPDLPATQRRRTNKDAVVYASHAV